MAGKKETATTLNNTLLFLIQLLNDNNIDRWFVCYGTLLGLIRENSCIDGDDDIDIIIDKKHFDKLKRILIKNGFTCCYSFGISRSRNIIKTYRVLDKNVVKYASIDIYMADFKPNGDVYDKWNRLLITNACVNANDASFKKYVWNEHVLYMPNDPIKIIKNRYGDDWQVKISKKIKQTMKKL